MDKSALITKFENHTASEKEVLETIPVVMDSFTKDEKEFIDLVIEQSNSNEGIQGGKMRNVENLLADKLRKLP